jgi:hypothetical protein
MCHGEVTTSKGSFVHNWSCCRNEDIDQQKVRHGVQRKTN